jgi:hypothetical protein
MKFVMSKPIAIDVALAFVAVVLLLLFDHFYGHKDVEMTRVGGTMNQCTCSERLEK